MVGDRWVESITFRSIVFVNCVLICAMWVAKSVVRDRTNRLTRAILCIDFVLKLFVAWML